MRPVSIVQQCHTPASRGDAGVHGFGLANDTQPVSVFFRTPAGGEGVAKRTGNMMWLIDLAGWWKLVRVVVFAKSGMGGGE
jgi:hypothetical protein